MKHVAYRIDTFSFILRHRSPQRCPLCWFGVSKSTLISHPWPLFSLTDVRDWNWVLNIDRPFKCSFDPICSFFFCSTIKLHALSSICPSNLLLISLLPFHLPLSVLTVWNKACRVYFFLDLSAPSWRQSLVYFEELVMGCARERKTRERTCSGRWQHALRLYLSVSHTWTRAKTPQQAKRHRHSRFHADAPGTAASIWEKKLEPVYRGEFSV